MLYIKEKINFFENKLNFMARIWISRILKNALFQRGRERKKNLMISKEKKKIQKIYFSIDSFHFENYFCLSWNQFEFHEKNSWAHETLLK
jgi:hypothetical protein